MKVTYKPEFLTSQATRWTTYRKRNDSVFQMKIVMSSSCTSSWHCSKDLIEIIRGPVEVRRKECDSASPLELIVSDLVTDARELILICSARTIEVYFKAPSETTPSYACTVKAIACQAHGESAFRAGIQLGVSLHHAITPMIISICTVLVSCTL